MSDSDYDSTAAFSSVTATGFDVSPGDRARCKIDLRHRRSPEKNRSRSSLRGRSEERIARRLEHASAASDLEDPADALLEIARVPVSRTQRTRSGLRAGRGARTREGEIHRPLPLAIKPRIGRRGIRASSVAPFDGSRHRSRRRRDCSSSSLVRGVAIYARRVPPSRREGENRERKRERVRERERGGKGGWAGSEPAEAQDAGLEIARDRNAIPRVQSLLIATLANDRHGTLDKTGGSLGR